MPPIRPMVSLSRANIFADGEMFLQVRKGHDDTSKGHPRIVIELYYNQSLGTPCFHVLVLKSQHHKVIVLILVLYLLLLTSSCKLQLTS